MDPRHAKRLHKHTSLTEILIQVEDFLDGLDLYVFRNWFKGEIFKGPEIRRYWVDVTLKYNYEDMPDPQGGMRLIKHGAKVEFKKDLAEEALEIENANDYREGKKGKPEIAERPIWLVTISIPRKFIEELDDDDLELYDDGEQEVDANDVSDARDENIDQEDALKDGAEDGESDSAPEDEENPDEA